MSARKCNCVYATSKNTASVRSGHEMGGYLKVECDACKIERVVPEADVPPILEGTWRITQPNGRQFLVHSGLKAGLAMSFGYTVELLTGAITGDLMDSEPATVLAAVRQAIADYHYALDTRQHGGVAQDRAFSVICMALGTHWVQGAELAKRRADAGSGESNQQTSTGNAA
jgi:hypothetical protein